MRTVIVSDLHFGNGGDYDIFAGAEELPRFLDHVREGGPVHLIVNGDGVDFLMNADPLVLSLDTATAQAQAIADAEPNRASWEAMGRILATGGRVTFRLGNHDAELALGEVQKILRRALGQPASIADQLSFQRGDAPWNLNVGRARILITHGEHYDSWNKLDYDDLPGPGGRATELGGFRYPPGSQLVKQILNPLKKRFRFRFADLLKPDVEGAVLTALAVDPSAVSVAAEADLLTLIKDKVVRSFTRNTFEGEEDAPAEGSMEHMGVAFDEADLSPGEIAALQAAMGMEPSDDDHRGGRAAFDDEGELGSAQLKLVKKGLKWFAEAQRSLVGDAGERFFQLAPTDKEWKEARSLAKEYDATAVLFGHTHACRIRNDDGLVYVNTGTWINLMQLPDPKGDDNDWMDWLIKIQDDPALDDNRDLLTQRFTAAIVEEDPTSGGARIQLVQWADGEVTVLGDEVARAV